MSLGVIIGRFQVPQLHEGHEALIAEVLKRHNQILVLVGIAPFKFTKRNPLPPQAVLSVVKNYMERQVNVVSFNKSYSILPLLDKRTDAEWVAQVDAFIDAIALGGEATLYTGRDGFNSHYSGRYPVEVLELEVDSSGTEIRKALGPKFNDQSFREGIVYAIEKQYPLASMCVDAVVRQGEQILLVRKRGEDLWRFPGGFLDSGETLETAVRRELLEETNIPFFGDPKYLFSQVVKDWRSTITSAVFEVEATGIKNMQLFTDNEEIEAQGLWWPEVELYEHLVLEHHPILERILG